MRYLTLYYSKDNDELCRKESSTHSSRMRRVPITMRSCFRNLINAFLFWTPLALMCLLSMTIFEKYEDVRVFVDAHPEALLISAVIFLESLILLCCCETVRSVPSFNYICFFAFTFSASFLAGVLGGVYALFDYKEVLTYCMFGSVEQTMYEMVGFNIYYSSVMLGEFGYLVLYEYFGVTNNSKFGTAVCYGALLHGLTLFFMQMAYFFRSRRFTCIRNTIYFVVCFLAFPLHVIYNLLLLTEDSAAFTHYRNAAQLTLFNDLIILFFIIRRKETNEGLILSLCKMITF